MEIIKVDFEKQTVSARELHGGLKISTPFTMWFSRMCEYGFKEGTDFFTKMLESSGGRPSQDADITIDMAKEICMIQRTEIGQKVRQYFLQLEKAWNTPEQIMARALKMADRTIESLKGENHKLLEKIEEDKPKTIFADAVSTSHTSILIGDLAKIIRQNGYEIGQNRLFEWLRINGYLIKSGTSRNMPTQRYVEQGLFRIKESTYTDKNGCNVTTKTPVVTGKGQVYFVNIFMKMKDEVGEC